MRFSQLTFAAGALLLQNVAAHGGVWNYSIVEGEWQQGFFPWYPAEGQASIQRHWDDFSPIKNLTSPQLVCNKPGDIAEFYATIPAGNEIKAYYRFWPHDTGPIMVWMARCGDLPEDCNTFDGIGNHWFKIQQEGLVSGTILGGQWAQDNLVAGNFTWNATIPASLKPGGYLIRHEIIALHVPYEPEFYPECAHLHVTGNGTALPGEEYLASIPGVYTDDTPDLHLSIYGEPTASRTDWTIPGPPVWPG